SLLGITDLRIQEAALPFDVSARSGLQWLGGCKGELREFATPVTGFGVQSGDTPVPRSGAVLGRRPLEPPGVRGVRPFLCIQIAEALVQRAGIGHTQRILHVRDRRREVSKLLI